MHYSWDYFETKKVNHVRLAKINEMFEKFSVLLFFSYHNLFKVAYIKSQC